jgi:hypothetical protein
MKKHTSSFRTPSRPSKSPQARQMQGKGSPRDSTPTRESRTPSPKFMFVPMSSEPGRRAKVQPGLRASAKAHVMHDYQRKTAEKRLADWKLSTPASYLSAPSSNSIGTAIEQGSSVPSQIVAGWEPVVFEAPYAQGPRKSPSPESSSRPARRATPSVPQRSSPAKSPADPSNRPSQHLLPAFVSQPRGSGMLNPFHTFPIEIHTWDEVLITRWLNYDRIPWCPVNVSRSECAPFRSS